MGDLRQLHTLDLEEQKRESSCSRGEMLRRPAFFSVVSPVNLVLSTTSIRSCQHCRLGTDTACWLSMRIDARPYFPQVFKNAQNTEFRFLEHEPPTLLAWPYNKFSLLKKQTNKNRTKSCLLHPTSFNYSGMPSIIFTVTMFYKLYYEIGIITKI